MSLLGLATLISGCSGTNRYIGTQEDLEKCISQKLAGEAFVCSDKDPLKRTYITTDREIEFTAYWDNTIEDSYGRQYFQDSQFKCNYDIMVHDYWDDEINSKLQDYHFTEAINYPIDDRYASSAKIYYYDYKSVSIYIDNNATDSQIDDINSFLLFLRDLCVRENAFHTNEYAMKYNVSVNWINPDSDEYNSSLDYMEITSVTEENMIDVRLYGHELNDQQNSINHHATFGCYIRITNDE